MNIMKMKGGNAFQTLLGPLGAEATKHGNECHPDSFVTYNDQRESFEALPLGGVDSVKNTNTTNSNGILEIKRMRLLRKFPSRESLNIIKIRVTYEF